MRKFQIGEKIKYQGCSGLIKRVYADGANPEKYDVVVTTLSGALAVPRVSGTWLESGTDTWWSRRRRKCLAGVESTLLRANLRLSATVTWRRSSWMSSYFRLSSS